MLMKIILRKSASPGCLFANFRPGSLVSRCLGFSDILWLYKMPYITSHMTKNTPSSQLIES